MLALICILSLSACSQSEAGPLAAPEYPEMAHYPNDEDYIATNGDFDYDKWQAAISAYSKDLSAQKQYESACTGLDSYFAKTAGELLSSNTGENIVYSPVNLYLALGMLAEITDSNTRQQIFDLIGEGSIEDVRRKCTAVWNACYRDTGNTTSIPASSIWLKNGYPYREEVLQTLASEYYASSYSGEMGSIEYSKQLQNWLNENTRGLLEDAAKAIEFNEYTRIALATTLYFNARWDAEFNEVNNGKGLFSLLDTGGTAIECDFMHQTDSRYYYWGEKFSAVKQSFKSGGGMWLILPDEGVPVNDLAANDEAINFILSDGDWENSKYLTVNLALPRFDISATTDLSEPLKALGVTDVFDDSCSDFSPLTDETLILSKATHSARVKIDEEGCEAAAFTVMMVDAAAAMPPDEEVDFILNRPFMFVITGDSGLPLFIGTVNKPE